uniref:Ovule protein n=1 Tax=Heterorhabditis bacteriophora TaxID=37862 RepID=A0A1I7WJ42_HETBA
MTITECSTTSFHDCHSILRPVSTTKSSDASEVNGENKQSRHTIAVIIQSVSSAMAFSVKYIYHNYI